MPMPSFKCFSLQPVEFCTSTIQLQGRDMEIGQLMSNMLTTI